MDNKNMNTNAIKQQSNSSAQSKSTNQNDATKPQATMKDIVNEKDQKLRDKKYNDYVSSVTPKHSWPLNMCKAFLVGGVICAIGQFFLNLYMSWGADEELAISCNIVTLVFLSVLLTGLGIYPKLAKFGGAGTIVPITGFANSVAAPAIEFKKEGQVFGIGCQIFTIAGPVILYGIFSSWVFGIIYYFLLQLKVIS